MRGCVAWHKGVCNLNVNHSRCPVCDNRDPVRTVERAQLPAMQNYVYRTTQAAHAVQPGKFSLAVCERCGFGFNAEFDTELLTYDRGYDNSVPSAAMGAYYESLADYLNATYLHGDGLIVDVGCGKGTFLQTLCRKYPQVRGLGIDPSYEGSLEENDGQLRFIRDFFSADQFIEQPSLVICRHALEHIERPVAFLASLHAALKAFPNVPIFVEVPDLDWILRNEAFWDFCYEHCNYFTRESLRGTAERAGFHVNRVQTAFGDQYLWLEGALTTARVSKETDYNGLGLVHKATQYVRRESSLVENARRQLAEFKRKNYRNVLWGMATKGTLFSYLVDPQGTLIDKRIDININKQGCYTPLVGQRIDSPTTLAEFRSESVAVVVMNENYSSEILTTCRTLGIEPTLVNAACQAISSRQAA